MFEGTKYAERLLARAEYRIMGFEGARRAGNSTSLHNLGTRRDLGAAVITDATMANAWKPTFNTHRAVELDGTNDYIALPAGFFVSRAAGTLVMLCRVAAGAHVLISDDNDDDNDNFQVVVTNAGSADTIAMAFVVAILSTGLTSPNGAMKWSTWVLLGAEWGPDYWALYADGLRVKYDTAKSGGSGAGNSGAPTIGKNTGTPDYAPVHVAMFALWDWPLGAGAHRAIQGWRSRL